LKETGKKLSIQLYTKQFDEIVPKNDETYGNLTSKFVRDLNYFQQLGRFENIPWNP